MVGFLLTILLGVRGSACAVSLTFVVAASAEAGAWTKRKHEGLFIAGLGVHWLNPFDQPANQGVLKAEASIYVEFGLTDRITLVGRGAFQQLQDRVRGLKTKPLPPRSGIGGMELGARVNLVQRGPWVGAFQVIKGIPGSGENWTNEEFGARGGDLDIRVLLGRSIGRASFIEAAIGVRARGREVSDELRLDVTAGCDGPFGMRLMVQSYSIWAPTQTETRRSYSNHRLQGSILVPLGARTTAQMSLLTTLQNRRLGEETAFIASIWREF